MRTLSKLTGSLLTLAILAACSPDSSTTAPAAAVPAQPAAAAQQAAAPAATPAATQAPAVVEICRTCATVVAITPVVEEGQTTGVGAVIGGIVGGVAGNQVGGGSGQQIATVAGVVGGALLGNNIERNRNAVSYTDITVEMDTGERQTIRVDTPVTFGVGAAVNVQGTSISLR